MLASVWFLAERYISEHHHGAKWLMDVVIESLWAFRSLVCFGSRERTISGISQHLKDLWNEKTGVARDSRTSQSVTQGPQFIETATPRLKEAPLKELDKAQSEMLGPKLAAITHATHSYEVSKSHPLLGLQISRDGMYVATAR